MSALASHVATLAALPQIDTSRDCYTFPKNGWFCPAYLSDYSADITEALTEHLWVTVVSVLLGAAIAFPLALLARRSAGAAGFVLGASTVIYTIPSLAMFSLLLPYTRISPGTVVVGLALYTLTILVRNIVAGFGAVPDDVLEAGRGLGYGPAKLLVRVELPLALPVIMAGLRVATVSTVALVTVGSIVGYGGLGNLLLLAIDSDFKAQIFTASVLCVLIAIAFDVLLFGTQRLLTPWQRARV